MTRATETQQFLQCSLQEALRFPLTERRHATRCVAEGAAWTVHIPRRVMESIFSRKETANGDST